MPAQPTSLPATTEPFLARPVRLAWEPESFAGAKGTADPVDGSVLLLKADDAAVGELRIRDEGPAPTYVWRCPTSDEEGFSPSEGEAKTACEASFHAHRLEAIRRSISERFAVTLDVLKRAEDKGNRPAASLRRRNPLRHVYVEVSHGSRLFRFFGFGEWQESLRGSWTPVDPVLIPEKAMAEAVSTYAAMTAP